MSRNTIGPPGGFSERAAGFTAQSSSVQLSGAPSVGCESSSGLIHFLPSIAPWGCVIPGELLRGAPIFVNSLFYQVSVNNQDFQIGDQVRVQGQVLEASGESFRLPSQTVEEFTDLRFPFSDAEALELEGKRVEIFYVITRNGEALTSPSLFVDFVLPLVQTGQISIEGVSNGQLEIDKYPNGLILTVPKVSNLRTNNAIEIYVRSDLQGGPGAQNWRDYQRKLTVTPESPVQFRIEPSVYQGFRGESIFLYGGFFLGAGMVPGISYGMGPQGILEFKLI
ncbi:hypothetical protein HXW87_01425 [Pseudomonas sp. Y5-11]|jgi:hypothetical protein|uniref:hypothetical protein n=1 Tax=unclassified Pseudomonas TaxID=196821 RepID=UPI0015FD006E|nr:MULTISPECIES: hypothetical protein [unclassified Pseudomonas]MBA5981170.1 hypothetical protein [Pseudomonas sp. MD195_PC81_125]ULN80873.1 hypothetical protein HXW87_01425 [Pseudomonas sp. Y5-11]